MENETIETKEKLPETQPQRFVVGVQYRQAGKIYTFLTDDATLARGDEVVVEAEQGTSIGTVIEPPQPASDVPNDIKKVLRRASAEELDALVNRAEREIEIFELFSEKVSESSLPMKPLAVELREGEKKAILTFFAEERVDFRSLVKELATRLHMRIEMHQIGARDEVKCRGGIGSCGFLTCCSQHLRQFQSISIQMAKNQGLTPNPTKLTGICSKLKCCLAYENSLYAEIRQRLPRVGMLVKTPQGNGKVVGLNILSEQCIVRLDEGGETKVHLREIVPQDAAPAAEADVKEEGFNGAELQTLEDKPKKTSHKREYKKEKKPRR